jgi:hypothetical protein
MEEEREPGRELEEQSEDRLGMTPEQWEQFQAFTRGFGELAGMHPRLRGFPEGLPFVWDERTIRAAANMTLETDESFLDILGAIPGIDSIFALFQTGVAGMGFFVENGKCQPSISEENHAHSYYLCKPSPLSIPGRVSLRVQQASVQVPRNRTAGA